MKPISKQWLIIAVTLHLDEANLSHKLTCQALPNWILKINVNNWTSRTSIWRIWLIEK